MRRENFRRNCDPALTLWAFASGETLTRRGVPSKYRIPAAGIITRMASRITSLLFTASYYIRLQDPTSQGKRIWVFYSHGEEKMVV